MVETLDIERLKDDLSAMLGIYIKATAIGPKNEQIITFSSGKSQLIIKYNVTLFDVSYSIIKRTDPFTYWRIDQILNQALKRVEFENI